MAATLWGHTCSPCPPIWSSPADGFVQLPAQPPSLNDVYMSQPPINHHSCLITCPPAPTCHIRALQSCPKAHITSAANAQPCSPPPLRGASQHKQDAQAALGTFRGNDCVHGSRAFCCTASSPPPTPRPSLSRAHISSCVCLPPP